MPTVPNSVRVTLGPEVHDQMSRSSGQSDAKNLCVKFQSKLGTHFVDPLKGWIIHAQPGPLQLISSKLMSVWHNGYSS
ncbi:hypothetical protein TNCV_2041271 [Trichonephila clavipes]|nr:hypothetical protein TNCV_2041271 [Trichonephila clavipes]